MTQGRTRILSGTGFAALMILFAACSGSGDVVANDFSEQLSADAQVAADGVEAATQADTIEPESLALPEPQESTQQSVLVVLADGDSNGAALSEDSTADQTSTTTSTTAATSSETTASSVVSTTVQATVATTGQTATTAAPTTAAPATAAPTTAAPTTAAPTTTTSPPTTQPPGNSSFPDDNVLMVASGAEATFSSQVANSGPVVIWFWLPG